MMTNIRYLLVFASLACALPALADIIPAPVFTSNAVLQEAVPVPVWGTADPGERVSVKYNGQEQIAVAAADGKWMVKLLPLSAGTSGTLIVSGKNTVTFENVVAGEVWLCSGQSNMAFSIQRALNADQEIAEASHPEIRFFVTKPNYQKTPQAACEGRWVVCSPETAAQLPAVPYFFGRELHRKQKAPVGLVVSAEGGTQIQPWTSREAHEQLGQLKQIEAEVSKAEQEANGSTGKQFTPQQLSQIKKKTFALGGLHNGMIAPLIPYAIRGAIWYQGESNSHRLKTRYNEYLAALVTDWREKWGYDFPVAWVQLPEFKKLQTEPVEDGEWTLLREAMLKALSTPKTGMIVTLGLGEAEDIHPKNKQDVGRRLAFWALGDVYKKSLPAVLSPLPEGHSINGNQINVTFSNADGGLIAKDGKAVGFAICGEDRQWVWAEVKIEKNKIIASSASVSKPVALRYAWADNPVFSLYNQAGLPASPFRTDSFPPNISKQNP